MDIDKFFRRAFKYTAMSKETEFIEQLEGVMGKFIGKIVCQSIMRNQLARLNKDKAALTADDCSNLTRNVQKSVALFATKEEAGRLHSELDKLFKTYFS